ncbi:MAG: PAS domain-containing protein [Alphaproteobacteria bacterium]|nr:PAS domain-containing protein [Alphaproteobacteria bacterium]
MQMSEHVVYESQKTFDPKEFHDRANIRPIQSESDLKLSCNRKIFSWWNDHKPDLPTKSSFEILDHIRYASNLFLVERLGKDHYKFIISGEEVNEIVGRDPKVKEIQRVPEDAPSQTNFNLIIAYYNHVLDDKTAHFCHGTTAINGKPNSGFESIDCPLANDKGEPTYILGCMRLLGPTRCQQFN